MSILVSIGSYLFSIGAAFIVARSQMDARAKLLILALQTGLVVVLQISDVLQLFTTMGMLCFLALWLSSIGILSPQHSITYALRVARIKWVMAVIELGLPESARNEGERTCSPDISKRSS